MVRRAACPQRRQGDLTRRVRTRRCSYGTRCRSPWKDPTAMLTRLKAAEKRLDKLKTKNDQKRHSRRGPMTLCPVAIAIGCRKCPVFTVCPVKGIIVTTKPTLKMRPRQTRTRPARMPMPRNSVTATKWFRASARESVRRTTRPASFVRPIRPGFEHTQFQGGERLRTTYVNLGKGILTSLHHYDFTRSFTSDVSCACRRLRAAWQKSVRLRTACVLAHDEIRLRLHS
jgi:hypothetical protein